MTGTAQQPKHQSNIGVPVVPFGLPYAGEVEPPDVKVPTASKDAPVKVIRSEDLQVLGARLTTLFEQYRWDRRLAEFRWLRNQRQYLGIYDPEIESELSPNRSKAYPKITRSKCIAVLSKLMSLMFPGDERNWELEPSPDPDISIADVKDAIQQAQQRDQEAGNPPSNMTPDWVMASVHDLMCDRAKKLSVVIDDQLQELGGDQTYDYVALNRQVLRSGINYGLGLLRGPFARECKSVVWEMDDEHGIPLPKSKTIYKPQFSFVPIWNFYPDLAAKTFSSMDGFFLREVMGKSQLMKLCDREDFFCDVIKQYLDNHPHGNYTALEFEWELRVMGLRANVNDQKPDSQKYVVYTWVGKLDGHSLRMAGAEVDDDKLNEELDAEVWFVAGNVICCKLNPWAKLGVDVRTLHYFMYDEDDTSPVGFGLPNAIRDSQMMVSAATRMMLDNASIVCGPNLELNTDLLRPDQDLSSIRAYRMWYRGGSANEDPQAAMAPAVRNIKVESYIQELLQIIDLGLKFADSETFVGPADGADQSEMPSEPYRTASGASMLRGNQALPFKDMVRAFDCFTQSVIQSIVAFNKVFNPSKTHAGDYNVIARGATSLIAKEVRGMQADQLVSTLTPEEKLHIDARKLLMVRLKSRDMDDILVSDAEAARRQQAQDQEQEEQEQHQQEMVQAQIRKLLSDAYKNIASGQLHVANSDATTADTFLQILERGVAINGAAIGNQNSPDPDNGIGQVPAPAQGQQPGGPGIPDASGAAGGGSQG